MLLFPSLCLPAQAVRVHTQEEMNSSQHALNSHAGEEQFSSLEKIWRYTRFIKPSEIMTEGLPDEQKFPWYPRVKALPDGRYIMFYHGGQVSSRIFRSYSSDLLSWKDKFMISGPKAVKVDGRNDYERYCNMEAAVLQNGTLLGVQSFRASDGYRKGLGCGIRAMRSHDNGVTWTRPNVIYEGPNWEPYILELPDGTVQVYFTDCDPRSRNSGVSVIESRDGGVTFGPKKRVVRQFKYYWEGQRIYTSQMPVFRVLNDGKTVFGIVEERLEPDGAEANVPGGKSEYWISLVRNGSPDWTDLGEDSEGPKSRNVNALKGNSGYVVTLPSGEVLISSGIEGRHSIKIGNATATKWNGRNFESDWYQPFEGGGCWGSMEAAHDKHHIISVMDAGSGGGVRFAVSYLNHRIEAPASSVTVDGRTDEWIGDEALFIGSDSPVETIFRASNDGETLYLAAEWVNTGKSFLKTVDISLCNASAKAKKGTSVTLSFGPEGLVSASVPSVKATANAGKTIDGRKGGVCEIAVPLSSFGAAAGEKICFNASVNVNMDGKNVSDGFWMAGKNPSTWQRIQLSDRKVPEPFKASHSGEEQFSVLQPMPSFSSYLEPEWCLKDLPESAEEQKFACYPRIKKMTDGEYIMFWMGGRFGSRIWCSTSPDLKNWSEPQLLFTPYSVVEEDGKKDVRRFVNPDAVVLPDGDILVVCSYRASSHYHLGVDCGLMTRRSSDNGRTWSEPQQICDLPNWEPYLLLLPDGRLHCYFTHAVPGLWNSGTSVTVSTDGGRSWGKAYRCSRQFKYVYKGHNIYTDQMPSFRVLADGKTIAGFLESRNETKVPLDYSDKNYYSSYCKMSMVYNDGLDWADLGENSAGPARRHTNTAKGAGGYIVTFPSGEVVVGRGSGSIYGMKILTSDAELVPGDNWTEGWTAALPQKGYWGTMEVDTPSTLVAAMHSDKGRGLQLARFHLNHRIDAARGVFSADSLYLGSETAEVWFTASRDADNLILRAEVKGDVAPLHLRLCGCGEDGIVTKTLPGGSGEVRIPFADLGNPQENDYICMFASMSAGEGSVKFAGSNITMPKTWQRIRIR